MLRLLLVVHRWLGVVLCLLFLLWFPSGIGMMYWGMPTITARDRLARMPVLDPAAVRLSPIEAAERLAISPPAPGQVRLNSFDGRPAYRFGAGGRGGSVGSGLVVYADTGEEQFDAPPDMRSRAAAAWTGQPAAAATIESVTEPDQWVVGNQLRNLRPLWRYVWPDGQHVYIGESGDVLLHTTRATRLQAYLSAIPHWLYFTPLRKHQPFWIRFATYTAMAGTAGVVAGLVIAAWLYSPSKKKYRFAGKPSSVPYRGAKRWHTVLGLVFGLLTLTWTFSGSLAFLPFPQPQSAPQLRRDQPAGPAGSGRAQGRGPAGRRGGDGSLAAALRGEVTLDAFAPLPPGALLARFADLGVREVEFTSFDGRPVYALNLGDGTTRRVSIDGRPIEAFDHGRIVEIVKATLPDPASVETRLVDQYDYYYLDRTRQRPLPVMAVLAHDADNTRYYIDPKSGSVAGTYSDRNWARRFFYNGLHSLSFPWLYNHRPLWDVVVIVSMLGGTALCLTSLVLAWRVLGKRLGAAAGGK